MGLLPNPGHKKLVLLFVSLYNQQRGSQKDNRTHVRTHKCSPLNNWNPFVRAPETFRLVQVHQGVFFPAAREWERHPSARYPDSEVNMPFICPRCYQKKHIYQAGPHAVAANKNSKEFTLSKWKNTGGTLLDLEVRVKKDDCDTHTKKGFTRTCPIAGLCCRASSSETMRIQKHTTRSGLA